MDTKLGIQKENNSESTIISKFYCKNLSNTTKLKSLFKKLKEKMNYISLINFILYFISFFVYLMIQYNCYPSIYLATPLFLIVSVLIFFLKFVSLLLPKLSFILEINIFFLINYILLIVQLNISSIQKYNVIFKFDFIYFIFSFILICINILFKIKKEIIYFIPFFISLFCMSIYCCYTCSFDLISLLLCFNLLIISINNFLLYSTRNVFLSNFDLFFNIFTVICYYFELNNINSKIN